MLQPDDWFFIIVLIVLAAYALSRAYANRQALAGLIGTFWPAPPPIPIRGQRVKRPHTYTQRTCDDRTKEARLIAAGLREGLAPADIALMLRGNPAHNRRRINGVARMVADG